MSPIPGNTDPDATQSVFQRLRSFLAEAGVAFTVLEHAPVYTSEDAAAVRGTPLSSGAKALILKVDDRFAMFVLPADRKLDSRKLRSTLGVRNSRFANGDEVLSLTGLRPGSIPPFGSLFQLATYCDPALGANPTINFNAGDHTMSISLAYDEYVRVEQPTLAEFSSAA
jgi:Ala-tRNA(Pro) deacylase